MCQMALCVGFVALAVVQMEAPLKLTTSTKHYNEDDYYTIDQRS